MAATFMHGHDPRAVRVDMSARRLQILNHGVKLRRFGTLRSLPDRYVDLVRQVRGVQRGKFVVREADLQTLAATTGVPVTWLDDEIRRAMEEGGWSVPGVGLATTSGLVLAAGLGVSSRGLGDGSGSLSLGGGDGATIAAAPAPSDLIVDVDSRVQLAGSGLALVGSSPVDLSETTIPTLDTSATSTADGLILDTGASTTVTTLADLGSISVVETALPHHEAVGAEAMELISYDIENKLPGWSIDFQPGRAGTLGFAYFDERRIEVYVRDHHTAWDVASTLAHELGHAVDVSILDDAARWAWMDQRGITADWWPAAGVADYSSGAGDFAEAFAVWQVGGSTHSRVAGPVTGGDLERLERLAG